jgi:hypothetical protein
LQSGRDAASLLRECRPMERLRAIGKRILAAR